jgi:hypothetical protein
LAALVFMWVSSNDRDYFEGGTGLTAWSCSWLSEGCCMLPLFILRWILLSSLYSGPNGRIYRWLRTQQSQIEMFHGFLRGCGTPRQWI